MEREAWNLINLYIMHIFSRAAGEKVGANRARICKRFRSPGIDSKIDSPRHDNPFCRTGPPEPVFLNVNGAQVSIPRNEFRQPV